MSLFHENSLLHKRFMEVARKFPDHFAVATEDGSISLTYQELDERSTLLAQGLVQSAGDLLTINSYIGVMTQRGIGMVVALLGILKAGAAYVPVDPSFPKDRQAYIFSHSKCPLLIVDEETYDEALTLASAAEKGATLPTMFAIEKKTGLPRDKALRGGKIQEIFLPEPMDPRPVAYVLYTSGSTGKPKGVMVYQDSVLNIIDWFGNDIGMTPKDRCLGLTTYCFDISVLEMFMPLTRGSGLVVTTSATQKDPFRIVEVLEQMHITIMQATPTTFEMCLATGWKGDPSINFLVGGEAFRPKLKEIIQNCKSMRNVYGPTETTIWSSSYLFDPTYIPETIPIGKEISETDFYIVNEQMQLLKEGEDGELCIGGLGVAKGYIHAADLTEARFIPNPFGSGRIYRTGDQVRKLPDGNYVFMNRLDDQVKIHGYRIELGEIEQVIAQCSGVNQAVVLVRNDRLIAYIRPHYGNDPDPKEAEVIQFVSKKVPHYMVPSRVICLKEFPQTANGKLDKKAFPDPVDEVPLTISSSQKTLETSAISAGDHIRGVMNVAKFLCLKVFNMTGKHAKTTDSLAVIGLDSLSSVFFRTKLLNSFEGVSLGSRELFDPEATISSIAIKLQQKILAEKPHLLTQLGFELYDPQQDLEMQQQQFDHSQHQHLGQEGDLNLETQMLQNRAFLDGMRGLLAIWVFGDHFGHFRIGSRIVSDTLLFLMISGVATSLQFTKLAPIGSSTPLEKDHFQWFNFLLYRWMALFPMYYVAMFICIPRMIIEYPNHLDTAAQYTGCVIMYICCFQTWTPWSNDVLPDLFYTGVLWNIFLIYTAWKVIETRVETVHWRYTFYALIVIILIITFATQTGNRTPAAMIPYFLIGMAYTWLFKQCFAGKSIALAEVNQVHPIFVQMMAFWKRHSFLYRHGPDVLALLILFFILMNWWGLNKSADATYENLWGSFFFPVLIGLLTCLCMLQDKHHRCYFTTYLCENHYLGQLGQCSYPMYIFQLIVVNYYLRIIFDHDQFNRGIAPSNYEYAFNWGHDQAPWMQLIFFVIIVSIAFSMQKIFQDRWITGLFNNVRMHWPMTNDADLLQSQQQKQQEGSQSSSKLHRTLIAAGLAGGEVKSDITNNPLQYSQL